MQFLRKDPFFDAFLVFILFNVFLLPMNYSPVSYSTDISSVTPYHTAFW